MMFFPVSDLTIQLSVIIPVYNEASVIEKLTDFFIHNSDYNTIEVIVVDGGSTDDTIEIAKKAGASKVVLSPEKGRAAQMHYGASIASGTILYFVHADTFPPASFGKEILDAVRSGFPIGRYQTKFDSTKWYLKINAWFTRFDWFICMGGDQTLFISKELYQSVGGFNTEMKIMEEFEFVARARENVKYKIFKKPVLVSARKYDTNTWWQIQMANKKIVSMYKKGASQQEMIDQYNKMLKFR